MPVIRGHVVLRHHRHIVRHGREARHAIERVGPPPLLPVLIAPGGSDRHSSTRFAQTPTGAGRGIAPARLLKSSRLAALACWWMIWKGIHPARLRGSSSPSLRLLPVEFLSMSGMFPALARSEAPSARSSLPASRPTGGVSSRASNGFPKLSSRRVCAASVAGLSTQLRKPAEKRAETLPKRTATGIFQT